MAGERRDVLPPELLRIGVQFGDGRTATNIGGHDRPVGGPVIVALGGGGGGGVAEERATFTRAIGSHRCPHRVR